MERCELCEEKAMVQCDSYQAKLCWHCDAKVNSANFLVTKHIKVLLCRICNSHHTQWKACGPKLIPSTSFCHHCVANGRTRLQHNEVDNGGGYISDDDESDTSDDEKEDDDDEEENQVVPMYTPLSHDSTISELKRERNNSLSIQPKVGCMYFNGSA
ncbi:hypothetical protein Lal_00019573 [Lupinus albus]|uniref:Putative transcription factor interactor and regulator Znf-B family n=1 Tax=Lupinus albus TaxID=3870 RepID=A0A6A5PN57_LUPAL|nr:putative transcription factor interactor and regulator Znf-B family [Lupinus albus]KAF1899445.1 hypothetical protein Lal_00019573 [Lupinus albus]